MPQKSSDSDGTQYAVAIPLDASAIGQGESQDLKVVARAADGTITATTVTVSGTTTTTAELTFASQPGALTIAVGPASASDEQILSSETVSVTLPSRAWVKEPRITLAPVPVSLWHWLWWLRWCRTFQITGRLVCTDGSPVAGATVCAYDIDWWFLWTSKQQVGCATTGIDGSFTIDFEWCCGIYPWWWWFRDRAFDLDPLLSQRVSAALGQAVDLPLQPPGRLPTLAAFSRLISDKTTADRPLAEIDPGLLDDVRQQLLVRLPASCDMDRLRVWPWYPWAPWNDCAPDIIFTATQPCGDGVNVIVDETFLDTRWDVDQSLSVTLVANSKACCVPTHSESDCFVVDAVCDRPLAFVGGNLGAPVVPAGLEGYQVSSTLGVDNSLDLPFGGVVPINRNPDDTVGVDYYTLEQSSDGGVIWSPLPAGASLAFNRQFMLTSPLPVTTGAAVFAPISFGGYDIYESREHFEASNFFDWSPMGSRIWLSTNFEMLAPIDSTRFADGLYRFRVRSVSSNGDGTFTIGNPIQLCDKDGDAEFMLRFDNRAITPIGHDPSHNCGDGVHLCTVEPDTSIISVVVNGNEVGPCDTIDASDGTAEITFLASDADGNLGSIYLSSHWGASQVASLTGGTLTPQGGAIPGWTYAEALANGASRPTWNGGIYTLTVPVTTAFPEPCCYLLRLEAYDRTIVGGGSVWGYSCDGSYGNVSEMTLGVGIAS